MRGFAKGKGQQYYCCYCKRELTPALPEKSTSFTLDHAKCLASGGHKRVPCCRKCNQLKGDLHLDDWFWFIRTHARWWKVFDTNAQVQAKIREFRFLQAQARKDDALRGRL